MLLYTLIDNLSFELISKIYLYNCADVRNLVALLTLCMLGGSTFLINFAVHCP